MTDKEIMIDGVDVSRCKFYRDEDVYSYEDEKFISGCCEGDVVLNDYGELMCYRPCKGQDCYFKQLARKTQEYNDLLEQHKELDDRVNRMIEEKYNLGNECEWLKYLADANPNSTLRLRNKIRDLQAVSVKYKEALEEIEEYLDAQQKYFDGEDYHNLLDIINKVKGIGKNI